MNKFPHHLAALTLTISACSTSVNGPTKSPLPQLEAPKAATPPSTSKEPATLIGPSTKYFAPINEKEFFANYISCEGNAMAETAYIETIQRRTKMTEIPAGILPCNIILDMHNLLGSVINSCNSVKVPLHFDDDNEDKLRLFSSLITTAREVSKLSTLTQQQIEKNEKRCFPIKASYDL